MRRRLVTLLLAIVTALSSVRSTAAQSSTPSEARRLADQALAEYKEGESAENGWQEHYDRGLELARRAIAIDPTVADAHYAIFLNLGRRSERSGVSAQFRNLSELKDELARTIELDPNHAHAWEARGEMLTRLPRLFGGSQSEGEQALRRSKELAPTWAKPVLRLAQLHQKKGLRDEARAEAAAALELAKSAGEEPFAKEAALVLSELAASDR